MSSPADTRPPTQLGAGSRAIYGLDDRIDAHEVACAEHLRAIDCTAAIFLHAAAQLGPDGAYTLATRRLGAVKHLDPGARFADQPIGAAASAVRVGPDLLLTAAHVIDRVAVARMRAVFGFHMCSAAVARVQIDAADVYTARLVARGEGGPPRGDWALLRLDRPADDRPFAALDDDRPLAPGQAIYTVGHPMGLPVKLAGNARVLARGDDDIFTANLDVFPACSGSPVFNADTHALVGIVLADPHVDHFLPVDGFYVPATFPEASAEGNSHLRARHFAAAVRAALTGSTRSHR